MVIDAKWQLQLSYSYSTHWLDLLTPVYTCSNSRKLFQPCISFKIKAFLFLYPQTALPDHMTSPCQVLVLGSLVSLCCVVLLLSRLFSWSCVQTRSMNKSECEIKADIKAAVCVSSRDEHRLHASGLLLLLCLHLWTLSIFEFQRTSFFELTPLTHLKACSSRAPPQDDLQPEL